MKTFKVEIEHTTGYIPDTFTVKLNDTVRFLAYSAPNQGWHNHGITIDEFGVNRAATSEDPDRPAVIEFVANETGTFSIYCRTCWDGPFGHQHPDIRGTLIVEP